MSSCCWWRSAKLVYIMTLPACLSGLLPLPLGDRPVASGSAGLQPLPIEVYMTRPFGAFRAACALMLLSGLLGQSGGGLRAIRRSSRRGRSARAHRVRRRVGGPRARWPPRQRRRRNMPLLAGDRVRTQAGRVEILFADGSTLHLDANTTVDFQSDELVRLLDGRLRLAIPGPDRDVSYRVDAPSALGADHAAGRIPGRDPARRSGAGSRARRHPRDRGARQRGRPDGAPRGRARVLARERRAVVCVRVQLRDVGRVRSLVGEPPRRAPRRVGAVPAR